MQAAFLVGCAALLLSPPLPAEQVHHCYYTPTVTAQHIPLKTQLASSLPSDTS